MILRRVIQHFRNQEWTAIFLDFIIVVVGVFVGLQVSNWNAARADQLRAHSYLERIRDDLEADLASYHARIAFWDVVSGYGASALDYVEAGDANGLSQWELLLAFFQASQLNEFYTTDTTYEELKSAGELGLIDDISLRATLAEYYTNADNPALYERPRYREHVRGVIPFNVQLYIWENCYRTISGVKQELLSCDSPVDEERATEILQSVTSNTELMEELRYWMSTLKVATMIGRDRSQLAKTVRRQIKAQVGTLTNEPNP